MNSSSDIASVVTDLKELRESYEYLKSRLDPMQQEAKRLELLLTFQSFFGSNFLPAQQINRIHQFIQSPELKHLRMIYKIALDSLRYKQIQLENMLYHNTQAKDNQHIAGLIREIALFIHDVEQDYHDKDQLVATISKNIV